jgi:ABC-type uncharacterized transport system permease subunit
MPPPNGSKERYDAMTKGQKIGYWVFIAIGLLTIAYFLFFYR